MQKKLTIDKQLLQNQEALESSTVGHDSHEIWYHYVQLVHSQPPDIRFLLAVDRLFPLKFSILGNLVAVSLLPLFSVFHFAFCDYLCETHLYSHLRLTDLHSRPRKRAS